MAKKLPTVEELAAKLNIDPVKLKKLIKKEVDRRVKEAQKDMAKSIGGIIKSLKPKAETNAKSKSRKSRKD